MNKHPCFKSRQQLPTAAASVNTPTPAHRARMTSSCLPLRSHLPVLPPMLAGLQGLGVLRCPLSSHVLSCPFCWNVPPLNTQRPPAQPSVLSLVFTCSGSFPFSTPPVRDSHIPLHSHHNDWDWCISYVGIYVPSKVAVSFGWRGLLCPCHSLLELLHRAQGLVHKKYSINT